MPFAVPARDMSCADRAGLGRLMPRLRLSPPTFAHGARRCGAGGRERERADCSANTYRLEVIYTALERYDQGRHNAHTKKWGADDYNSCAGVIANSPGLDADDYINLHEGRRHGLSSTRGVSNLRLRCVSHLRCDPPTPHPPTRPRTRSRSPRQGGEREPPPPLPRPRPRPPARRVLHPPRALAPALAHVMPRDRIGAPPSRDRIGSLAEGLGLGFRGLGLGLG